MRKPSELGLRKAGTMQPIDAPARLTGHFSNHQDGQVSLC